MVKKISLVCITAVILLAASDCFAYIVTAKERNVMVYGRSKVETGTIQYEIQYDVNEKERVIYRKQIKSFRTQEKIEDSITYSIMENLPDASTGEQVIKAVGKSDKGYLELLIIGKSFVLTCRSTADYFIVTDMQRDNATKPQN